MSMAEYWDEAGSGTIEVGKHIVTIDGVEHMQGKKGPGVKYWFKDSTGARIHRIYWLTHKALPFFALLLKAVGLTRDQGNAFNYESIQHHEKMVGKQLGILVEKDGEYNEVKRVYPASEMEIVETPPQNNPSTDNADDDLPF